MSERITWTSEEWMTVARSLMALRPEYSTSLPESVYAPDLRKAIEALPEERRRPVNAGGSSVFRPGLSKAYAAILSGTELAPTAKKPKVYWSDAEYMLLAEALHELDPTTYINSSTLISLTPADLRLAEQKALPVERHRNLHAVTSVREPLIHAFRMMREQQEYQRIEEAQPAPEPAAAPALNIYEAAFKPFIALIADELMARIAATYPPMQQEAAARHAAQHLSPRLEHPETTAAPFKPTPKPRIGVVGILPQQAQDLLREFPQLDFVFEKEKIGKPLVEAMRSVTRIIGMADFINHGHRHCLQSAYGEKWTSVNGSVSAIKRQIRLWLHSGALTA